jgi:hypothetical protein
MESGMIEKLSSRNVKIILIFVLDILILKKALLVVKLRRSKGSGLKPLNLINAG